MFFFSSRNKIKELEDKLKHIDVNANNFINILLNEIMNQQHRIDSLKKINTPEHVKELIYDLYKDSDKFLECSVCLCDIEKDNLFITSCGHYFHNECQKLLKNCPLCHNIINEKDAKIISLISALSNLEIFNSNQPLQY